MLTDQESDNAMQVVAKLHMNIKHLEAIVAQQQAEIERLIEIEGLYAELEAKKPGKAKM